MSITMVRCNVISPDIDDIVEGITRIIDKIPEPQQSFATTAIAPYQIYNIGNNQPVTLRSLYYRD